MGWNIRLVDKEGNTLLVPRHQEGGTYAIGGTTQADLSVTYNYSPFYYKHIDETQGLKWLDGRKADSTIERLAIAIADLGTMQNSDYWAKTAGNAGHALSILLRWAWQHPEGVWEVR